MKQFKKSYLFFGIFCFLLAILNAELKTKAGYHSTCEARRNTNVLSLTCDSMFQYDDIVSASLNNEAIETIQCAYMHVLLFLYHCWDTLAQYGI